LPAAADSDIFLVKCAVFRDPMQMPGLPASQRALYGSRTLTNINGPKTILRLLALRAALSAS
jgi:hypothetical protein